MHCNKFVSTRARNETYIFHACKLSRKARILGVLRKSRNTFRYILKCMKVILSTVTTMASERSGHTKLKSPCIEQYFLAQLAQSLIYRMLFQSSVGKIELCTLRCQKRYSSPVLAGHNIFINCVVHDQKRTITYSISMHRKSPSLISLKNYGT